MTICRSGTASASHSQIISGHDFVFANVNTVVVQAYSSDGTMLTTGGDLFKLIVSEECSSSCLLSSTLPIELDMQDNGDGTYSGIYNLPADASGAVVGFEVVLSP